MIRISSYNNIQHSNYNNSVKTKNKSNQQIQNTVSNEPSFAGKIYPSGIYSNWFTDRMKNYTDKKDEECDESINRDIEKYREESRKSHLTKNLFGKVDDDVSDRLYDYNNLKIDLKNEKKDLEAYTAKCKKNEATRKDLYEKEKQSIKNNQLAPIFCDQVINEKQGEKNYFPDAIMLIGEDKNLNEELIKWIAENSDCNFRFVPKKDDMDNFMDSFFETLDDIQESGQRTLLYVENFEDLINPQVNTVENIDQLKAAMCVLDKDYKTTLIFSTDNPNKLSKEATGPNRIQNRINTDIILPELTYQDPDFEHKDSNPEIDSPDGEYSSLRDYNKRHKEPPSSYGDGDDGFTMKDYWFQVGRDSFL